ncbi:hypothetical protein ABZ714_14360 [Streptomyces sp. NPDC006798]|uniref:hypothetical protein n=1 Tax=unclassified Streptomyces TaxID=2593676 RepID=UPI0033D321C6
MKGFKEVRTSPEMEAVLQEVVDEMLAELGEGYEGNVQAGSRRSRGGVVTASEEAARENSRDNTLLRALANAKRGD